MDKRKDERGSKMNRQKLMDDLIVGAVTVIGYGIVAAFLVVMVLICAEGG